MYPKYSAPIFRSLVDGVSRVDYDNAYAGRCGSRNGRFFVLEHGGPVVSMQGFVPTRVGRMGRVTVYEADMLMVQCWCERAYDWLSPADVLAGTGVSCGHARCRAPEQVS